MKLQKEVAFASEKLNALIERKGLATIKTYMANVYNSHEWQNYEVRIANDVVKYAAIGRELSGLLDRNPDANDDHITTLCISVMKSAGLLPFNPDEVPDEKPADKKAALLEKAETVPALTDELTRDELKAAADLLQDVADELAAIGYHSDALHVRSSLDYYRHAYMKKLHELTPEAVAEFVKDNGEKYAATVRHYIGEYLKAGDFCRALLYVVENYNGEAPAFVVKCSDYLFNKYGLCTLHHVKVEKVADEPKADEPKAEGLTCGYYTIFVSKSGKYDETAFLWIETKNAELYRRALADVEPRGYKVAKIYKPADVLAAPDFTKTVNTIKAEKIATPTADKVRRYSAESLAVLTTSELLRLKAALNSEWEKLHNAGLYNEAEAVSQQTGRISNEQARRLTARAESIPEGVALHFEDGTIWPVCVFGFSVEDEFCGLQVDDFNYFATADEAVNYCRKNFPRRAFSVHAISRADAINCTEGALLRDVYTRRRVGRRLQVKEYFFEVLPDNVGVLATEYDNNELAHFLTNDEKKAEDLAHCLTRLELAVLVDKTNDEPTSPDEAETSPTTGEKVAEGVTVAPTTDNAPTSPAKGEGEAVGDFCPLTGCNLTDDGETLTVEEIKKIAHEQREKINREKAEKVATARPEVLAELYGTTDRAEVLAKFADVTPDEAAELLAACYSPSEKLSEAPTLETAGEIKAPTSDELTPEAVAVVEKIQTSPRPVVLFDLCAIMYEVSTRPDADGLHKWQALTACGVFTEGRDTLAEIARKVTGDTAPTLETPQDITDPETGEKSPLYRVAEKVGKVAAVVLLSLTIGNSTPAQIYTDSPADVLAQVAEAGETVTAYTIAEA